MEIEIAPTHVWPDAGAVTSRDLEDSLHGEKIEGVLQCSLCLFTHILFLHDLLYGSLHECSEHSGQPWKRVDKKEILHLSAVYEQPLFDQLWQVLLCIAYKDY